MIKRNISFLFMNELLIHTGLPDTVNVSLIKALQIVGIALSRIGGMKETCIHFSLSI